MADVITADEEQKQEETTASVPSETDETSQETPNGVKTKEKHDGKEKSSSTRRGNRYHPYKEKHGGEKKSSHRNRVFISNIPYDMKWQAIKDLMRDKGNVPGDGMVFYFQSSDLIRSFQSSNYQTDPPASVSFSLVCSNLLTCSNVYPSGMGGLDRDFDMPMNRGFGDSFGGMGGGMGSMSMDRMGSSFDRVGMSGMDMNRGFGGYGGGGHMSGGMSDRGFGAKGGCQIFVRNLSYDLTWQKLKDKFSHCGHVMFAEIKMENGRSKGCGTVRFDSPESAEKACRMMNGTKINGREVDVRIDRNA
uniref:Myelin expression factor 2 n=1 Tax=Cyprinodon variegatus TaxID=28743 RepID=A0A3Q2CTE5_CYPVA